VNPTQFNESSDLRAYPRDEARDEKIAAEEGVDYLFAPAVDEMYPNGFATTVSVAGITETLEGAHRGRTHFDGMTTVVTKLFNIVSPDVAYFGQKDAQQVAVIRRLVRDLDSPARIRVCPTVRDPDGLALSSRNAHLSPDERARATRLNRALQAAQDAVAGGERDARSVSAIARTELTEVDVAPEYLELVSADTMIPVRQIDGHTLAVVAAQIGGTRLIDNHLLSTSLAGSSDDRRH
jgi:pantoate--beta-alanine ligase